MKRCKKLYLKITPSRIHFFKFILEGYEGLGLLSTVSAADGIIVITYPACQLTELTDLLEVLYPKCCKT
jgi:hypothetical protein